MKLVLISKVLSNITPTSGSEEGGSQLTLNGEYFRHTDENPLFINVDDVPCSVLRANSTMIQCQLSKRTANNRTNSAGNRGCHIFTDNSYIDLVNKIDGDVSILIDRL